MTNRVSNLKPGAIPRRWQLSLVFMVTLFVAFIDRLNITYALPLMAEEYGWTELQLQSYGSRLMSLFYVAYGIANIFLTPIAARWGTRNCLLVIVLLWSVFTAAGAFVSQFMMLFLISRILLGLSEGIHVPMMMTATKAWFPPGERSRANSIVALGIFSAALAAPFLLVPLMSEFGWRSGFHFLALLGLVVSLPLVFLFVRNTPQLDARISKEERAYIADHLEDETSVQPGGLSWSDAVKLPGFALLLLSGATNNLIGLGLTSWIPTYFHQNRGIPFSEITWLVAGPTAFSLLGVVTWAFVGDRLNLRALMTGIAAIIAGVALFFALRAEDLTGVILLMSLAVFFLASFQASEFALLQHIVPQDRFASLAGLYNGASIVIGGGLGPYLLAPIIGQGEG
ncbi:MAG: MFS transporter, partial [Halioglobus sp.]